MMLVNNGLENIHLPLGQRDVRTIREKYNTTPIPGSEVSLDGTTPVPSRTNRKILPYRTIERES